MNKILTAEQVKSQIIKLKQKQVNLNSSRMPKNFIRLNIENIKGTTKPPSIMEDDYKSRLSVPKTQKKYNNIQSTYKQPSLNHRVEDMEKRISDIQNNQAQSLIISHITEIKDDIRLIKSHLFQLKKSPGTWHDDRQRTQSSGGSEENIYSLINNNRMRSQGSENSLKQNHNSKVTFIKTQNEGIKHPNFQQMLIQYQKRKLTTKKGLSIKNLYPMLKQYKLEGPEFGSLFYGYSKRNNQEIVVKHVPNTQQANHIIEFYDKMWKNITKAKWPCINRIYDYKIEQQNLIIMEKNRCSISNLPYKPILIDILKSLQYIHQCGYLYRNIEPEHFMLNEEGQLTLIDFKRAKRHVDLKGHALEISDPNFAGSLFASNNQLRGFQQGKKDDLESLGYFALILIGYEIPWYGLNKQLTIKVRSSITLQQLYKGHSGWIQYMATVMKMGKNDKPDYRKLQQILQKL